ncbi:MAG: tetratricopeptide repeat protein [Alphaproteobacteria bacterium]
MSFKKTSDGKVFFKGANTNEAHEDDQDFSPDTRVMGAETQLQILALLRSLNEKLQTTQVQSERFEARLESFRGLIEALEQKTVGHDRALSDLDKKVAAVFQETRGEFEKTRQALLQFKGAEGQKRSVRESVLAQGKVYTRPEAAQGKRREFNFTTIYAAVLSLFVVGGLIFMAATGGFVPITSRITDNTPQGTEKVDLTNQEQLDRMMGSDPDPVAAALNNLEPGAIPTQDLHGLIEEDSAMPNGLKDMQERAFSGSMEDQHNLGALYASPKGELEQDYTRAAFWFRQAAERGMANAQYNLGVMYHQGLGVEKDLKQAVNWYKAAAAQNHAEAQYNLGIAYIEGAGVEYDPARAVENFERAADQGVIEASYNLGLIYENALLGRADPSKALAWYKRAADQGSPEATSALEQLARTLNIEMKDIDRVIAESGRT